MTRNSALTLGVALALLLAATARSQADLIRWQYNATPGASNVFSGDVDPDNRVFFTNEGEVKRAGNSFITASNLTTFSVADDDNPSGFVSRDFTFTVALRNGWDTEDPPNPNSLATGILTFNGRIEGTLWGTGSQLTYTILNPTQEIEVANLDGNGSLIYTVSFDDLARRINGPAGSRQTSIDGSVTVRNGDDGGGGGGGGNPPDTPEPATALLAAFGIAGLGALGYRRAKQAAR